MQQRNSRQYDYDGGNDPDDVGKTKQAYEKFERLHPQLQIIRSTPWPLYQ